MAAAMLSSALLLGALTAPRWSPTSSLDPKELTVGRTVVPTLARRWKTKGEWKEARADMFAAGLYPGVDYIIEDLRGGRALMVRPAYPLIAKLERDWPVLVETSVAPRWMDPAAYNALTACFAFGIAMGGLLFAVLLSATLTFSVVPSASMEPAVRPNDVLLVEKVTPRFGLAPPRGSLVLFSPPQALQQIVRDRAAVARAAGGSGSGVDAAAERLLFVKRVAAGPGDRVAVDSSSGVSVNGKVAGPAIAPGTKLATLAYTGPRGTLSAGGGVQEGQGEAIVPLGNYFVLGDNSEVSVDSRCWGFLPQESVAGRPLLRIFPLSRFGLVADR